MTDQSQNRVPRGTPSGGQFAQAAKAEADVRLHNPMLDEYDEVEDAGYEAYIGDPGANFYPAGPETARELMDYLEERYQAADEKTRDRLDRHTKAIDRSPFKMIASLGLDSAFGAGSSALKAWEYRNQIAFTECVEAAVRLKEFGDGTGDEGIGPNSLLGKHLLALIKEQVKEDRSEARANREPLRARLVKNVRVRLRERADEGDGTRLGEPNPFLALAEKTAYGKVEDIGIALRNGRMRLRVARNRARVRLYRAFGKDPWAR